MKLRLPPAFLLLLVFALPVRAAVSTYTWAGATTSFFGFDSPSNWFGGVAPPSSATDTALVFSSAISPTVRFVDESFTAYGITFSGSYPAYRFQPDESDSSFSLGAGGITVAAGTNRITFSNLELNLLASQTWNISGNLVIEGFGDLSGGSGITLTKSGTGTLTLGGGGDGDGGFYSFSGNINVTAGTLLLANGSDGSFGPAGSALITLRNGARLASTADIMVNNSLVVESGAILGNSSDRHTLSLTGLVTLQSPATTLNLGSGTVTQFLGSVVQPGGTPTSLAVTGLGLVVLAGDNNVSNGYTGGTTANGAGVLFGTAAAVPNTGAISATNNGYVGSAAPDVLAKVLGKITPATFTGSLGLDTGASAASVQIYSSPIDLSAFSSTNFKGLGSVTSAQITGTISTVGGGDYKFGGGTGTLWVDSNLVANGTAGLTLTAPLALDYDRRFTLILRGANTFTGPINVSGANLVLDSVTPFLSTTPITLGAYGYAGYTEQLDASFGTFLNHIAASPAATAVIGIDSHTLSSPVSVGGAINLSRFTSVYLGSATKATLTSGATITAPSGGTLSLAGVNDGYLKVEAPLFTTNGVSSVNLGLASNSPYATYSGAVELDNSSSNYAGNTTLASGYLIVGASSVRDGPILFGPIGTGTLVIPAISHQPVLASTSNSVTLHNPISLLGAGLVLGGGAATPGGFGDHGLTLNGVISGTGSLDFRGRDTTFTLNASNTFSGGISIAEGSAVVANSDTAIGTGMLNLEQGGVMLFTTLNPVIGGSGSGGISGDGSVSLDKSGASLLINQQREATYNGALFGSSITVTKTGSATLHVGGGSDYTGTTRLNQGTVVVEGGTPFGSSTVRLNGANLVVMPSVNTEGYFSNQIVFEAPSRLSGFGIFGAPLTVGANATLSPGPVPGFMYFANAVTFESGGVYEVKIQSRATADHPGSPGVTNDTLALFGGLAFSTATTPFRLDLISISTSGAAGNIADFDPTVANSWQIALVSGAITGFTGTNATINAAGFTNSLNGGFFSLSVGTYAGGLNALTLNFTPVPEPSTWALLATGLGLVAHTAFRRKRRNG